MTLKNQLFQNPYLEYRNNIFYQKYLQCGNVFEENYLDLRGKENRIFSDDVVRQLPNIKGDHPFKMEWDARGATLKELIKRLASVHPLRYILEIGCGNGWLSYNLAASLNVEICAIDVNEMELLQGARVFVDVQNLSFIYADIFSQTLETQKFDAVILGSSVQYFHDLRKLISKIFQTLRPSGQIYIVDSPFYSSSVETTAAKKRSVEHFTNLGVPEMSKHYFHHTFDELGNFNFSILYNPRSFVSLFKRKVLKAPLSIFPIICIPHESARGHETYLVDIGI
jgi:ubiquinone/menaquinone biosynthesis C-methylase UbiE